MKSHTTDLEKIFAVWDLYPEFIKKDSYKLNLQQTTQQMN